MDYPLWQNLLKIALQRCNKQGLHLGKPCRRVEGRRHGSRRGEGAHGSKSTAEHRSLTHVGNSKAVGDSMAAVLLLLHAVPTPALVLKAAACRCAWPGFCCKSNAMALLLLLGYGLHRGWGQFWCPS